MSILSYISKITISCLLVFGLGEMAMSQQTNGFRYNLQDDQLPWSITPVISGESYRFLVLGDLTGGEVPGVFDYAIDRINELAPDFVITVGDIVEGYTTSREEATAQWDIFENSLSKLEMPFFVTAGNHDITNEMLADEWKKRWGYLYYSFYAGKNLFIVMNYYEKDGFSTEQVEYVISRLDAHQQGDPVFLIIHDALWKLEKRKGFTKLKDAFNRHDITFFCGHEHRYQHRIINGQTHYMLAGLASGGLRGQELGEFYNLMQVNVNKDQIRIANIDLKGLLPVDIVNDETIKQVDVLRSNRWVSISPTNLPSEQFSEIPTQIRLSNPGDFPLDISGLWPTVSEVSIEPAEISALLQPGASRNIDIKLRSNNPMTVSHLPELKPTITARFRQPGQNLTGNARPVWVIDHIRQSQPETKNWQWPAWESPGEVEESWDWSGHDDAAFTMNVSHNDQSVFIRIKVTDDTFLLQNETNKIADELRVFLTTNTESESPQSIEFEYIAGAENMTIIGVERRSRIKTDVQQTANELTTTIIIPRRIIPENRFRLNLSWNDKDNSYAMDNAVLWWKPRWGSNNDYPRSGFFLID